MDGLSILCRFGAYLLGLTLLSGCGAQTNQAVLREGFRALKNGQESQAIPILQAACASQYPAPDRAMAYNGLGIAHARMQKPEDAARMFAKALEIYPDFVPAVYNQAVLQYEAGALTNALGTFARMSQLNKYDTRALEYMAVIHQQCHQWDDARHVLEAALKRNPRAATVLTRLALVELQSKNETTALAFLRQAYAINPAYAPVVFNLGFFYWRYIADGEQARMYLQKYLALEPHGRYATRARWILEQLPPPPADVPPVVEPVKPAVHLPASPAENEMTAEQYMEQAKRSGLAREHGTAVTLLVKAAHAAERTGNESLRDIALARAAIQCSDDAQASFALAKYYLETDRPAVALPWLKQAVALSSNWFEAQLALATAAFKTEEFDTARLLMKQAEPGARQDPEKLWALAELCESSQHAHDMALIFYTSFIAHYPRHSRAATARKRMSELKVVDRETGGNEEGNVATNQTSRLKFRR